MKQKRAPESFSELIAKARKYNKKHKLEYQCIDSICYEFIDLNTNSDKGSKYFVDKLYAKYLKNVYLKKVEE